MKKRKIIKFGPLFLLAIFLNTLVNYKIETNVEVFGLPGNKYLAPDGTELYIPDYQIVSFSNMSYVREVPYYDSWWLKDHQYEDPAIAFEREKIPQKKQLCITKSTLDKYLVPSEVRLRNRTQKRKDLFFLSKTEIKSYNTKYGTISLEINPKVFPPSPQGAQQFINFIEILPGEKVIDIGTGSGIFSIAAAKAGGIAFATDTSKDATDLTQKNGIRNSVSIKTSTGNYFADFKEEIFDVVIANLPVEILPPEYVNEIGNLTDTISGGNTGTEIMIPFLKLLPNRMHANSRAYIMSYSGSMYKEILQIITERFDSRLLGVKDVPTKQYVDDNEEFFKKLNNSGDISIFKKNNKWHATVMVFELRLKT